MRARMPDRDGFHIDQCAVAQAGYAQNRPSWSLGEVLAIDSVESIIVRHIAEIHMRVDQMLHR